MRNANKQKGLVHILLLVIILIVGVGITGFIAYKNGQVRSIPSFSPTPTPNSIASQIPNADLANWKTYTNNKYGYSLKYESNPTLEQRTCGLKPNDFNGEEWFILQQKNQDAIQKICYPLESIAELQIVVESTDKTSEKSILQNFPKSNWNISIKEITIANKSGKMINAEFIGENESGLIQTPVREVRVFNNGYTYFIDLTNFKLEETFDQILSTFKFLD